jgi:hypothetical protein
MRVFAMTLREISQEKGLYKQAPYMGMKEEHKESPLVTREKRARHGQIGTLSPRIKCGAGFDSLLWWGEIKC